MPSSPQAASSSSGETIAEHRQAALGLGASGFVLEDVPVLGEPSVLDADDVGGDPCGRAIKA